MKKLQILFLFSIAILSSCSEEPIFVEDPFVVAFKETSGQLLEIENQKEIALVYSKASTEDGILRIQINTENALYGRDFVTIPAAVNNELSLSISVNETENNFQIVELNNSFTDVMKITFLITSVEIENSNIQGYASHQLSDSSHLGGTFLATVGGPNEPNQVYIDLSSNKETVIRRDAWDLGFYAGDEFRVAINGSLYMATSSLKTIDINSVNSTTVSSLKPLIAVGTFNPNNSAYVDAINGNILETAIGEISEDDSQNPVYLLNLGVDVGNTQPPIGSIAIAGDPRGWKKIRVLREGNGYKLQYADLDATSYNEVLIAKKTDFNFTFFSFNTDEIVNVEPQKLQWDICFTVFTSVIPNAGSYGFSDFVIHNRKGGVTSYSLVDSSVSYEEFDISNIDSVLFEKNQTVIGSSWRDVFKRKVKTNIFYVLEDSNNNYYKIRFLDLVDGNGERGYPRFEYTLLQ